MRSLARVLIPLAALGLLAAPAADALNAPQSAIVSAVPAPDTPQVLDGAVHAIAQVGGEIVVGGSFTQVRTPGGLALDRQNLFAFDAQTGAIDPSFAPAVDGEVKTLAAAPDGHSVFAGGSFGTIDGAPAPHLAKLAVPSGQVDATFKGKIGGSWVDDMALHGSTLYVGGAFTSVNGVPRSRLAALDETTGAVSPDLALTFSDKRRGTLRVAKLDVSPDGSKLVAIGTFTRVNGASRQQIAMIDLSTTPATLSSWQTDRFAAASCSTHFDTYLRDVDFAPDGSYFVVVTTGAWFGGPGAGVICDSASRWESGATGAGLQPSWIDYTGGDSLTSVAVTGTAVYVGGHERWLNNPFAGDRAAAGAVSRMGIAALDPQNGLPFSWNPGRKPRGAGVWALLATSQGLWVGSDTSYIGGKFHPRLALMPLAGGSAVPPAEPGTLPGELYSLAGSGAMEHRSFDGSSLGASQALPFAGVDWSQTRGAFMLSGKLYTGWSDGRLYVRSFDGQTAGAATALNLGGLTSVQFPVASVTGMFYDQGRLYYTVAGDTRLFYRYFEPESGIVGAETFVASGAGDGLDWSAVRGMTLASGRVYLARTDGNLYAVDLVAGRPVPVTMRFIGSAPSLVSRGLFVLA